jgi:hypothetical protein
MVDQECFLASARKPWLLSRRPAGLVGGKAITRSWSVRAGGSPASVGRAGRVHGVRSVARTAARSRLAKMGRLTALLSVAGQQPEEDRPRRRRRHSASIIVDGRVRWGKRAAGTGRRSQHPAVDGTSCGGHAGVRAGVAGPGCSPPGVRGSVTATDAMRCRRPLGSPRRRLAGRPGRRRPGPGVVWLRRLASPTRP